MKKSVLLPALLVLAFAVALAFAVPAATLTKASGDVAGKTGGADWAKASVGQGFSEGDSVRTGAASKAELSVASGGIRLFENTLLVVPGGTPNRAELGSGSAVFKVKPGPEGFSVKGRRVIAGVKGTSWGQRSGEQSDEVIVYGGQVEVTDLKGKNPILLNPGQRLTITDSGPGKPEGFDPATDGWGGWSTGSTPPLTPGAVTPAGRHEKGIDGEHRGQEGSMIDQRRIAR